MSNLSELQSRSEVVPIRWTVKVLSSLVGVLDNFKTPVRAFAGGKTRFLTI